MNSEQAVKSSWQQIDKMALSHQKEVKDVLKSENLILFGAGPHGQAVLRYLKQQGITVRGFIDNDPKKQGGEIDGLPIDAPSSLANYPDSVVLVTARHAVKPILKQLADYPTSAISFDTFFATNHLERLAKVRNNLLNDSTSKLCFDGLIKTMMTGNNDYCAEVAEANQYFALPQFFNIGSDHYIDAGAYVGDTIERFLWAHNGIFSHIYAFEPGAQQFNAMEKRLDRLCDEWAVDRNKFTLVQAGLGEKNGELSLPVTEQLQSTSFIATHGPGEELLPIFSIDQYFQDKPVSCLKADIEGMEIPMLQGAQETIKRYRPRMALSIYHEPTDLFEIAEYVHNLVPEYKMAVRQHAPLLMDTVLYCWV